MFLTYRPSQSYRGEQSSEKESPSLSLFKVVSISPDTQGAIAPHSERRTGVSLPQPSHPLSVRIQSASSDCNQRTWSQFGQQSFWSAMCKKDRSLAGTQRRTKRSERIDSNKMFDVLIHRVSRLHQPAVTTTHCTSLAARRRASTATGLGRDTPCGSLRFEPLSDLKSTVFGAQG